MPVLYGVGQMVQRGGAAVTHWLCTTCQKRYDAEPLKCECGGREFAAVGIYSNRPFQIAISAAPLERMKENLRRAASDHATWSALRGPRYVMSADLYRKLKDAGMIDENGNLVDE